MFSQNFMETSLKSGHANFVKQKKHFKTFFLRKEFCIGVQIVVTLRKFANFRASVVSNRCFALRRKELRTTEYSCREMVINNNVSRATARGRSNSAGTWGEHSVVFGVNALTRIHEMLCRQSGGYFITCYLLHSNGLFLDVVQ